MVNARFDKNMFTGFKILTMLLYIDDLICKINQAPSKPLFMVNLFEHEISTPTHKS